MAMNKKGFLRILEVMIAITLLGGSIIYVYSTKTPTEQSLDDYISIYQDEILTEITINDTLRRIVIEGDEDKLAGFVSLPEDLNFTIKICEMTQGSGYCNMDNDVRTYLHNNNILEYYTDEKIIAANVTHYSPKKVKIFIWQSY